MKIKYRKMVLVKKIKSSDPRILRIIKINIYLVNLKAPFLTQNRQLSSGYIQKRQDLK